MKHILYVVGSHQKCFTEMLLMSTYNIYFYGEMWSVLLMSTQNMLLWRTRENKIILELPSNNNSGDTIIMVIHACLFYYFPSRKHTYIILNPLNTTFIE